MKQHYQKFEEWYYEQEGFALRAERLSSDIGELRAAFEAGQSYNKFINKSLDQLEIENAKLRTACEYCLNLIHKNPSDEIVYKIQCRLIHAIENVI